MGKLVCLHVVGIACGHSSSKVIMLQGSVCAGYSCRTSSGTSVRWKVHRSKSSTYLWLTGSHSHVSQVLISGLQQQICDWLKIVPNPTVMMASPQDVMSLPSALTSLIDCIGSMCLSGTQDFEATEDMMPPSQATSDYQVYHVCVPLCGSSAC